MKLLKNIWIDEFVCLRSKSYSFQCEDDKKDKLKGISKSPSKQITFEEYYKFLFGGEYQKECDNYIIRSIIQEMYPQQIIKSTLFLFHDKRCYINETKSKPWS